MPLGGHGPPYFISPKSLMPCKDSSGECPSLDPVEVGKMLKTTQWVHVPRGASGSSTISTRLFVPSGIPSHCSGGEIFSPSQVYFDGIDSFSLNTWLVKCKLISSSVHGMVISSASMRVDKKLDIDANLPNV